MRHKNQRIYESEGFIFGERNIGSAAAGLVAEKCKVCLFVIFRPNVAASRAVDLKQPLDPHAQVRWRILRVWIEQVGNGFFDLIALIRHSQNLIMGAARSHPEKGNDHASPFRAALSTTSAL